MPGGAIAVASDHAGFDLKEILKRDLQAGRSRGARSWHQFHGIGRLSGLRHRPWPTPSPPARPRRGVLVCGTGIGISIAANRNPKVRAALAHDVTSARLAREHNDANVVAFGQRLIGTGDGARGAEGLPRYRVRRRPPCRPRRQAFEGLKDMSQAAAKMTDSPLPMFTPQPGRGRSGDRCGAQGRAAPPARADRADRLGEHRLARGARGGRLGAHQQICRGLSRPALLRRLRGGRQGRAARHRPRLQAVRLLASPTCSRTPARRPTRRCSWRCCSPATRSWAWRSTRAAISRTARPPTSRASGSRSCPTA